MKKTTKKTKVSTKSTPDINKKLIENFISLQKIMVNFSTKFDNLSDQISKLLELFEISAKAMAEKEYKTFSGSDNKEVLEKLGELIEQNKTIARGLTLLHEGKPREPVRQNIPSRQSMPPQQPVRRPLPSERPRVQKFQPPQNYY